MAQLHEDYGGLFAYSLDLLATIGGEHLIAGLNIFFHNCRSLPLRLW